ncbi:MAG TPA: hypothetical protein PK095_06100, partial [Myxococcota bacterium]|nr:hypothetical protein [Myxococcota bacterium]
VDEASTRPHILLPVRESWIRWGGWGETPMNPAQLEVEVVGASGHRPTGSLEVLTGFGNTSSFVDGTVRWRPGEDLNVGERYTLVVVVPDSPATWNSIQCPVVAGFSKTVTFDVVESPPDSPELRVSVSARADTPRLLFNHCEAGPGTTRCVEPADVCCGYRGAWVTEATFSAHGPMPPPSYLLFEVRFPPRDSESNESVSWYQLAVASEPATSTNWQFGEGRPAEDRLCVTVNVRSLMRASTDEPLATVRACPDLSGFVVPEPEPLEVCPATECSNNWSLSQLPGRADVADVVEVADPGAEVADPKWDSSPGCGGGAGASWLGFAVLVGAGLRRSGASRMRRVDHA